MSLCRAPCRVYRRIDVGIGSHLAYVNGEPWNKTIEHLGNETHPQQQGAQGQIEYPVRGAPCTQDLRSPAHWNIQSQERAES